MTTNSENYEYSGVLHIHSRYSDGSGTMRKIIKAAGKAGLDYIIVTDHNTLQIMEDGVEGWYGDLLVLGGEEIGISRENHYLAFGISDSIDPREQQTSQQGALGYIEAVKRQGGIGFVSHPLALEKPLFDLHIRPWELWNEADYTGLEIWSYMYDWVENVTLFSILYYYLFPEKAIDGPPLDLLRRWDRLCQVRRVVGIGGADVHASCLFPFNFIKFLSYERAFRGIRTHLLTPLPLSPDPGEARTGSTSVRGRYRKVTDESKKLVYAALGAGHCFFAHDFLADSTGFDFRALTDEGEMLLMGDEAELKSGAELEAKSPVLASLRLFCDGELVKEAAGSRQLTWRASKPGVYRVEARYNGKPWVFTNPIYLRESIGQLVY